jgi:drug/metabolite transporter (DMT)-like permease
MVAIIWGVTFILVKQALNDCPPFHFATLRFGLSTILAVALVNRKLFQLTKHEMIGGFISGFLLFLGYSFQNFGLMHTTASKSAFITSVSVLLVPLLLVMFNLQKVKWRIWIAVLIASVGLFLLILPSGGGLNLGDILTSGCAISFAFHIIAQDLYLKKKVRILPFFCVQLGFVTLFSLLNSQIFEPQSIVWSDQLVTAIIITGLLATFTAFLMMIWAQKFLNPSETAIIFSIEPLSAALFATAFGGEILGFWGWIGGGLVCLAVVYGKSENV